MERACEGCEWLTVLTRFQYGTDIYREDFMDDLRYYLYLPLQNPPPPHPNMK